MKQEMVKGVEVVTFNSIGEFVNYCDNTPFNSTFWRESERHSTWDRYDFTRTKSYEEAEDLLNNGWEEKAAELNRMIIIKKE